ncbi:MAG: hypothetical protein AAF514_00140, partial [Verrucomicrobiota bacterium]
MSQSKIQAFTTEASPALESHFQTLLGQEITFKSVAATEATIDQIKTGATSNFTLVGKPEGSEVFIVQLQPAWIPVISNAMVGRAMDAEDEGVQDLAGQVLTQSYKVLQTSNAGLPALEMEPFSPGAWTAEESLAESYWLVPFSIEVADQSLEGQIYVSA